MLKKNQIQKTIDPSLRFFKVEGPFAETFTTRGYPIRTFYQVEYGVEFAKPIKADGIQKREGSVAFCIDLFN